MTALTDVRATPERDGSFFVRPVAAGAKIYPGALVMLTATGMAKQAATALNLKSDGRAEDYADNTAGADGAITIKVKPGCYRFANSLSTDQITAADVGNNCYAVDDQTVAKTNGSGTRSVAGVIVDVDAIGVWVGAGIIHP